MAFLSHSLPWHVLASMFEYADSSNPGPQHPELYAKSGEHQQKQLEYFASKFDNTVWEHSIVERRKYRPVKEYVARARDWTASEQGRIVTPNISSPISNSGSKTQERTLSDRNTNLRHLARNSWACSSPEKRLVFPPDFATKYVSYVPIASGADYGRSGIVEEFSHIETWIDFVDRNASRPTCTENERNRLWLDAKSCSDILRLLVIDAATTADAERRTHMLETIFLLAHHPKVGLMPFIHEGMACCNIEVGLVALVQKVMLAFVYLNLLLTQVNDSADCALLCPHEHMREYKYSYYRDANFVSLLPRPAYMKTNSFNCLLGVLLKEHGHVVEHVSFNPIFAPYQSGRRSKYLKTPNEHGVEDERMERDVFTDLPSLRDALKDMWKMLVYCDIIFRDIGRPINWEWLALDSIATLFSGKGGIERIFGKSWVDYELERQDRKDFGLFTEPHTDHKDK